MPPSAARTARSAPQSSYNFGRMLKGLVARGTAIGVYDTFRDARGLTKARLQSGVRSALEELTNWTVAADKVLVF